MKKIDLGQTITMFANIGVIASVVFLALEIRGNTAAIQQQEIGALEDQDQNLLLARLDPELADLYITAMYSPHELSRSDLYRLTTIFSVRGSILRRTYNAYRRGIVGADEWERRLNQVPIYWGTEFGRVWWEYARDDYVALPEFVRAINGALAESSIVPDDEWLLGLEAQVERMAE
jgi:hypothetical protein